MRSEIETKPGRKHRRESGTSRRAATVFQEFFIPFGRARITVPLLRVKLVVRQSELARVKSWLLNGKPRRRPVIDPWLRLARLRLSELQRERSRDAIFMNGMDARNVFDS